MKLVKYTEKEFQDAYYAWANAETGDAYRPFARLKEWDDYCDIRDRLPRGTSQQRRTRRIRAERPEIDH